MGKVRVLLAHTYYQQPGGEDAVFEAEKALLERKGHEVIPFTAENNALNTLPPLKAAVMTVWSWQARDRLRRLIEETRPHVAHFHNTFLMISPAAYAVCREAGVPVVQTLHNFRLLCPNAIFFRDGRLCEDCLGRTFPWPGIRHGCWRGRAETGVVASMLVFHRLLRTWTKQVDVYIALTEFARKKFVEGGLPAEKLVVKPNFVGREEVSGSDDSTPRSYVLFVGRLTAEKGILTVLDAWRKGLSSIPLKIVGTGPLADLVERRARESSHIEWLGYRERAAVYRLLRGARFLLFPTHLYETFGRVIIEAFATGTPVIASALGSAAELVKDRLTGLLCRPGDLEDWAEKVRWAWEHPAEMMRMGREAHREYELKYTPERNYVMLMQIYRRVLRGRG